jgi:hypothetical protein
VKSLDALFKDGTFGKFSDAVFSSDGASGACRFFRAMLWPNDSWNVLELKLFGDNYLLLEFEFIFI